MPVQIRLTTFNVENLFNRYAFLDVPWDQRNYEQFVQAIGVVSLASRQGDLVPYATTEIQRNNTAQAILDVAPDILIVQEIENIYTLRNFNDIFLDNYFGRVLSLDGNDLRAIDVGLLIKKERTDIEILSIRTHIDDLQPGKTHVIRHSIPNMGYLVTNAIFSRDCLEVDIGVKGSNKTMTLLINHFKAQDQDKKASDAKRTRQAERVTAIAQAAATGGKFPVVMGDLNIVASNKTISSIFASGLFQDPFASFEHQSPKETWTHYYTAGQEVQRLDYILPDKRLKIVGPINLKDNTTIFRKGLTTKCLRYTGQRYPTIGQINTEASDHCPVTIVLEL